MKNRMIKRKIWSVSWRVLAVFIIPILIAVGLIRQDQVPRPVQVGQRAPIFRLPTTDGTTYALPNHPKKVIIINFFTTWCPPCQAEAPDFSRFINQFHDQVQLVMIDRREGKGIVSSFIRQYHLQRAVVVLDAADSMAAPYGVTGQPETFGLDRQGIVKFHLIGPLNYENLVQDLNYLKRT